MDVWPRAALYPLQPSGPTTNSRWTRVGNGRLAKHEATKAPPKGGRSPRAESSKLFPFSLSIRPLPPAVMRSAQTGELRRWLLDHRAKNPGLGRGRATGGGNEVSEPENGEIMGAFGVWSPLVGAHNESTRLPVGNIQPSRHPNGGKPTLVLSRRLEGGRRQGRAGQSRQGRAARTGPPGMAEGWMTSRPGLRDHTHPGGRACGHADRSLAAVCPTPTTTTLKAQGDIY